MICAILIFFILIVRYIVERSINNSFAASDVNIILRYFVLAIAVVVMAIPEGLPLSVTISLAFSVKRML